MSALCRGPYGDGDEAGRAAPADAADCRDPAVFEVARHQKPPLRVCPVHLGPSLLMAPAVLWPPAITLISRTPGLRP